MLLLVLTLVTTLSQHPFITHIMNASYLEVIPRTLLLICVGAWEMGQIYHVFKKLRNAELEIRVKY